MEVNYKEINELILLMVAIKVKLMEYGLVKTAKKMDLATNEIGWEAAEVLEGKRPLTKLKSRRKK